MIRILMIMTMVFSPMLSSWGRLWLLITSTAHLAAITCCTVSRFSCLQPSEWRSTNTPEKRNVLKTLKLGAPFYTKNII